MNNKQYIEALSSELSLNCSSANQFEILLRNNINLSLVNTVKGREIVIWFIQDNTGNRTVTFNSKFSFNTNNDNTISTTANSITVMEFYVNNENIYCTSNTATVNATPTKFGNYPTSYAEFESDGTLKFTGDATVWKDIDFPIIIRTTGANIPTLVTLQGNVTAPQWAVNDYNVCEGQEFIHEWKEASLVHWHLHMITNGVDVTDRFVKWEVEYFWVNINGQLSSTSTDTYEVTIPANTPTKTMLIVPISTFTPTGGRIGGHVFARLRRIASVGTAPTSNPWCTMLQLHIECDTLGSRLIATK